MADLLQYSHSPFPSRSQRTTRLPGPLGSIAASLPAAGVSQRMVTVNASQGSQGLRGPAGGDLVECAIMSMR
jgi:hypothetical protein